MATFSFGDYTKANADIYFSATNHPESTSWLQYSDAQRTQAVAEAERQIWAALNTGTIASSLDWPIYNGLRAPSDINSTDRVREDYAIFEHALYISQIGGSNPNAENSGPKWQEQNELEDEAEEHPTYFIAPKALFWLKVATVNPTFSR